MNRYRNYPKPRLKPFGSGSFSKCCTAKHINSNKPLNQANNAQQSPLQSPAASSTLSARFGARHSPAHSRRTANLIFRRVSLPPPLGSFGPLPLARQTEIVEQRALQRFRGVGIRTEEIFFPGQWRLDGRLRSITRRASFGFWQACGTRGNSPGDYRPPALTSSVQTLKLFSVLGPNVLLIATSVASRPRAIKTRPIRGTLFRASKVCH